MGIKVDWDDNLTREIICYNFSGMWDWYDFARASNRAFRLMEEVPHPVGVIFDMSISLDIPEGAMTAMRRMLEFSPANMSGIVVTNGDSLTQDTFVMLLRLDDSLRRHFAFANSIDKARTVLRAYHVQVAH